MKQHHNYSKHSQSGLPEKAKELADASNGASRSQLKIYQSQIAFQVKKFYYQLLYRNEQRRLADSLIILYQRVLRAADIRYNTGETNILENTMQMLNCRKQ